MALYDNIVIMKEITHNKSTLENVIVSKRQTVNEFPCFPEDFRIFKNRKDYVAFSSPRYQPFHS